jgi:trehalose 6-phosphate phosphatase
MNMKYFLATSGLQELKRLSIGETLIALDFDGTLAPIVDQPSGAQMPTQIAQELKQLCCVAMVAIVSGRQLSDLRERVSAEVAFLLGNHGNEGLAEIRVDRESFIHICLDWSGQLRHLSQLHASGVSIEPKGLTLSVHYRHASDMATIQKRLIEAFDALLPKPRIVSGDHVFNLIPPGAVTKDAAMDVLAKKAAMKTVIYVGDDDCDELVFANAQPDWITIRIGYWKKSAAKYYLRYQHETLQLLKLLNLQLGPAASGVA